MALVLVGGLTGACGLRTQDGPQPVTVSSTGSGALPTPPRPTTGIVEIYLVRDDRLVPVVRPGRSRQDALDLLARGPAPLEARDGVRTALSPQPLVVGTDPPATGTIVVDVAPDFAALSGRDQLLAVAQLVWTATDLCCVEELLVRLDGRPVSLPTDAGLTERPVRRADYASVEPI